jgi:hypothetical protein
MLDHVADDTSWPALRCSSMTILAMFAAPFDSSHPAQMWRIVTA